MTSTATSLLNDDGSASMATPLLMSHHGFRRDIARFASALKSPEPSRADALRAEWQSYQATLHAHHQAEDAGIFPGLRARSTELAAVIDQLTAQHRRIDPLLEMGDRAFATLASPAEAALVVGQLAALLDEHLRLEEANVIPFIRGARTFPTPATDAEAEMFAQGFAWASDGVSEEVLDLVYAMLPDIVRSRLPAARAAFQKRRDRVWGPTPSGASRTSVPDWLR